MFNKKQRRHTVVETLVGSNSKINGDLHFQGGCHVDGHVKGSVTADPDTDSALSISDVGHVDGGVTVPYVVLNGIVKGDVYYNLIQMAEGAEINGKLVHQPEGQVPLLEQTTRIDEKVAASGE